MPPPTIKLGKQAGEHGSYSFYRSFSYMGRGKWRNVCLGKFFFVRLSKDSPICIGELQLVWTGRYSNHPLASIRLFYLPEQLPDGRQSHHGQDELLSTEKMVLHVKDLLKWIIYSGVDWSLGLPLTDGGKTDCTCNKTSDGLNCNVQIVDYTAYCRLRTALKRSEGQQFKDILNNPKLVALYGLKSIKPGHQIMFCKETFECPELENHDYRCDHLAPNLKGRPRKKGRPRRGKPSASSSNITAAAASPASATETTEEKETVSEAQPTSDPEKEKEKFDRMLKQSLSNKEYFTKTLYKYMKEQGTPITKLPSLGFKQVELHQFFNHAHSLGGYKEICRKRLWKHLYDRMGGIPHNTSAATCTKRQYERLLLSFEKHVVRSSVPSKGVLPASQLNKLRKWNTKPAVSRWTKKPAALAMRTEGSEQNESADATGEGEMKCASDKSTEDELEEDKIPLSRLKSERKEVSSAPTTSQSPTNVGAVVSSTISVWTVTTTVSTSSSAKLSSFNPACSTEGKQIVASSNIGAAVVGSASGVVTVTTALSTTHNHVSPTALAKQTVNGEAAGTSTITSTSFINKHTDVRPAHCVVKACRPLPILGPCHPHLLTAAQKSPWTVRVDNCYTDPMVLPSTTGQCRLGDLKRTMSDEVLDLSAKKRQKIQPAHLTSTSSKQLNADECGAIDLTVSHDKPLALVKVKEENVPATSKWQPKPWKPQSEPMDFSQLKKPTKPVVTSQSILPQRPREYLPRSAPEQVKQEVKPMPRMPMVPRYPPISVMPSNAHLFALPRAPSAYLAAAPSAYADRTHLTRAPIKDEKSVQLGTLQIDLTKETVGSVSPRVSSSNAPKVAATISSAPNSKHSYLHSPRQISTSGAISGKHPDPPPPRYGEQHTRVEPAFDLSKQRPASSPKQQQQQQQLQHQQQQKQQQKQHQQQQQQQQQAVELMQMMHSAAAHHATKMREVSPGRERLLSPHRAIPKPGEMLPSPRQHGLPHSQTPLAHHKQSASSPRPIVLPHQNYPSMSKLPRARQGHGEMLVSPRPRSAFSQRRHETPSSTQHATNEMLSYDSKNIPLTITGKSTPPDLARRQHPGLPSPYKPAATASNHPMPFSSHHSKTSSAASSHSQLNHMYLQPSQQAFQNRQSMAAGLTHLQYPRYPMAHPLASAAGVVPRPQPLLQRLPLVLNPSVSSASSLPAPPRLQPIPKPRYPHSSVKQMYK